MVNRTTFICMLTKSKQEEIQQKLIEKGVSG